ncbi:MAG TPA: hypothetical protein VG226_07425 [Acidimicrobiales bacterium]|nr:hypothetical protein [Acidimicrobiales bacterium]
MRPHSYDQIEITIRALTIPEAPLAGQTDALAVDHARRDGYLEVSGTVWTGEGDAASTPPERFVEGHFDLGLLVGTGDRPPARSLGGLEEVAKQVPHIHALTLEIGTPPGASR